MLAALLHVAVFAALAVLLTLRCVDGYVHPSLFQSSMKVVGPVALPVVTICPDQSLPSKLPAVPTCLYSLTQVRSALSLLHRPTCRLPTTGHHRPRQGTNIAPQPVSSQSVSMKIRSPTGHEHEYACYECNADRSAPLPATGISQLFIEVNRSGSGSPYSPTLIAYSGGAVDAEPPAEQQRWMRLYQQESVIHQLMARRAERLGGAVEAAFDVAATSIPCMQACRPLSLPWRPSLTLRRSRSPRPATRVRPTPALSPARGRRRAARAATRSPCCSCRARMNLVLSSAEAPATVALQLTCSSRRSYCTSCAARWLRTARISSGEGAVSAAI